MPRSWCAHSVEKRKSTTGGDFQLHASEAALNSMGNYFRTEAIFGGGNFLSPIHIVTQALYRALTERGMTRGLRFTPVVLF